MMHFMVLFLALWTLLHVYVFRRAATVPVIARNVPRLVLLGVAALLWSSVLLGRLLDRLGLVGGGRLLETVGWNWIAVLFLAFTALLAVDIVTGFGFLLRRRAPALRGWALVVAAVLSGIALVQGLRPPAVRNHEVHLVGLPTELDGTVLVAVSDFHLGRWAGARWLAARVAEVEALRPDCVVVLGDVMEGDEGDGGTGDILPVLRRLSAPYGVWAVTGNHEVYADLDESARLLDDAGLTLLRDRWVEVRPGLMLAGVDDLTGRRERAQSGDPVARALANRPAGATILLSHTPWQSEVAARAGVGLMLSAHTHGGQIWPFGYLVRLTYPLVAGRYEVDGMPVIVMRGTGTWGPRMRLWHRGEILRVTLRAPPAVAVELAHPVPPER
jgi:predicted MPP superfamily phosphohydrolase